MIVQLLVVLAGSWLTLVRCQAVSECVVARTQGVSVAMSGARNLTGHWIAEVVLRRSEERGKSGTAQPLTWTVVVEPRTASCGADKTAMDLSITFIAPPSFSRSDYELFPGHGYYKFHVETVTWPAARQACADESSHLMIINSEQEVEVLTTLFARYPKIAGATGNDWAWIGIHRPVVANGWITVLGDSLNVTYARWHPGMPTSNSGWDYVLANRNTGKLHDNPIATKDAFICEHWL